MPNFKNVLELKVPGVAAMQFFMGNSEMVLVLLYLIISDPASHFSVI